MKQAKLLALTITFVLLFGCGKPVKFEEIFSQWRQSFLSTDEHEIEASVIATDEKKVCQFTLLYRSNSEEKTVEVLAPETIAKIKAHIGKGETRLSYEGAILETGSTLSENLSPLMSLPVFTDIVEEGHVENIWKEKKDGIEYIAAELEMPDGMTMTLWLEITEKKPVYAEIRSKNKVEIKIDFINVI